VVRTAERDAAADWKIHPSEQQAINLVRLIGGYGYSFNTALHA
jgi:hypothetical protein